MNEKQTSEMMHWVKVFAPKSEVWWLIPRIPMVGGENCVHTLKHRNTLKQSHSISIKKPLKIQENEGKYTSLSPS